MYVLAAILPVRIAVIIFLSSLPHPHPPSTLFPYTTLFRSALDSNDAASATGIGLGEMLESRIRALPEGARPLLDTLDRKSTRLNSSHTVISYAVFCLKKKKVLNMIWP